MNELWKPIDEYNGYYSISNLGRIKNINGTIMKTRIRKDGYEVVSLRNKSKYKIEYIHILVAKSFIQRPTEKTEVNHIDANKSNNIVSNLEWVTRRENHLHAVALGLKPVNPTKGKSYDENPCVKPVYQYDMQGNYIMEWKSRKSAAEYYGCQPNSISRAMNGVKKSCKGFIWKHHPPVSSSCL